MENFFRVNNRVAWVDEFKYAIQVYKGAKGVAMATEFRKILQNCTDFGKNTIYRESLGVNQRVSGTANSNMRSSALKTFIHQTSSVLCYSATLKLVLDLQKHYQFF